MTGRRPDRGPFETIEVGIRRLRLVGLVLLGLASAIPGGHRPTTTGFGILVLLVGLGLLADRASTALLRGATRTDRLVALQLGADVTVTAGALIVFDPGPGDGLWLAVALPVVEGAIRFGVIGALATWLTTAVPVTAWTIAGWAPGDGLATMTETGGLLAIALLIGLPAGLAADRLADELERKHRQRRELERQAHLISVLSVASRGLSTADRQELCRLLVDATVELGYRRAEFGLIEWSTGHYRPHLAAPEGFGGDVAGGFDIAELAALPSGTGHRSPSGQTFGVLANDGEHLTILVAGVEVEGRCDRRHQAFEVLCQNGAAALTSSLERFRIDEAERRLDHRWSHDPVTGLLNRAGVARAITAIYGRLAFGSEARLVLVDLNGFARVNAACGWAIGDEVLVEIGARLRRTSPRRAAIGRLEADRFAIVTDDPAAGHLADHLRDILGRPITTTGGAVAIEASVAQVVTADSGTSPTDALREAERRVRAGKRTPHGDSDPTGTGRGPGN